MTNVVPFPKPFRKPQPPRVFAKGTFFAWCGLCGRHLSKHANRSRETPQEKYADPTQWFCRTDAVNGDSP